MQVNDLVSQKDNRNLPKGRTPIEAMDGKEKPGVEPSGLEGSKLTYCTTPGSTTCS